VDAVEASDSHLTALGRESLALDMQQHPLRVATQAALWLVLGGAALLAAVGFAIHATGSLRSRSLEFAQLRAIGLSRRRLIGVIAAESALLSLFGTIVGVGLGLALGWLVAPLVGASADGSTPVPPVAIVIPWAQVALLGLEVVAVLAIVVFVAARIQRSADPASVLRTGDER
jgi:ABC-type antimicrobial peptide transport system permease subunit